MDRIEFASNIRQDSVLLVNFFDSIMVLYDLIGRYQGLTITNNSTSAQIRFTVDGDMSNLQSVVAYINTVEITRYGVYRCNATIEGDQMIITLTPQ